MTCGIYKLNFNGTNKVYIGQSENIESRYINHIRSFKQNKASKKLQKAYEEFGNPNLETLIECTKDELNDMENNAIQVYDSFHNGFNSQEFAEDVPVLFGENHPGSKYSNEQIEYAFSLLVTHEHTHQEVSDLTGISKYMINHIAIGTCHSWLSVKYPETYALFMKQKPKGGNSKDRGKSYPKVVSPEGIKYSIDNLRGFAREHDLPYSSLNSLVNGRTGHVRGWHLDNV